MSNDKLQTLLEWVQENTFDTTETDDMGIVTSNSVNADYLIEKIQSLMKQPSDEIVRTNVRQWKVGDIVRSNSSNDKYVINYIDRHGTCEVKYFEGLYYIPNQERYKYINTTLENQAT